MLDLESWRWGGGPGAGGAPSPSSLQGPLQPPGTTATPHDPQRPEVARRPFRGRAGSAGSGAVGPRHRDGRVLQAVLRRAVGQRDNGSRAVIPKKPSSPMDATQLCPPAPSRPHPAARSPSTVPGTPPSAAMKAPCSTPFPYHPVSLSETLCVYLPSRQHSPPRAGSANASSSHRSAGTPPRSILTAPPPQGPAPPGSAPTAASSAAERGRCRCWRVLLLDQNQKRKQR